MTEIPEHLLKRAQAAREKAAAQGGADSGDASSGDTPADSRIPAHLLERSKAAKAGASGGVAVADKPSAAVVSAPAQGGVPVGAGPGGHTQRLLTLLQAANFNQTPNPSKAPWYFLGLQELLTMFHPMVAGVTIPGVGLIALMFAPYLDRNPSNKPEDRKFMTSMMTVFLMFWAVLVIISSFFRGPGYNFIFPWRDGIFFEL
jgi:hypothetical protein